MRISFFLEMVTSTPNCDTNVFKISTQSKTNPARSPRKKLCAAIRDSVAKNQNMSIWNDPTCRHALWKCHIWPIQLLYGPYMAHTWPNDFQRFSISLDPLRAHIWPICTPEPVKGPYMAHVRSIQLMYGPYMTHMWRICWSQMYHFLKKI